MGLFDLFSKRGEREDELLQREYDNARINYEAATSVAVLDELYNNIWPMEEYRKNTEYHMIEFMAQKAAQSELFVLGDVRPGLIHARETIIRKMEELGGLGSSHDIYDALVLIGKNGKSELLSSCCKSEVDWINRNMRR